MVIRYQNESDLVYFTLSEAGEKIFYTFNNITKISSLTLTFANHLSLLLILRRHFFFTFKITRKLVTMAQKSSD